MVTPTTHIAAETAPTQPHVTVSTREAVPQSASAKPATDTVRLSANARVHLLQKQGQTIDQIAVTLSLSPKLVASYLGTTPLQLEALSSTK